MKLLIMQSVETVVADSYDSCPTARARRRKGAGPHAPQTFIAPRCARAPPHVKTTERGRKTTRREKRRRVTFEEFLCRIDHLRTIKTRNRKVGYVSILTKSF